MVLDVRQAFLVYIVFLVFALTYLVLYSYRKSIKEKSDARIRLINDKLVIKRKRFDYNEKYAELKSWGFDERFEKPLYYFSIKILIGCIGAIALALIHPILCILGFVIGFFFFNWYARQKNKSDNVKMNADVEMIYNVLSTQLRSGVYIGTAMSELRELIANARLKKAFDEFDKHFKINDMTLKENIIDLESKFDNDDISALCMIIKQNEDNGHTQEILQDMLKQIHDMEEIRYEKIKARTDNVLTVFMMLLFADFMVYIIYVFVKEAMSML